MSHVEYFSRTAYFESEEYVRNFGVDLEAGKLQEIFLTKSDVGVLEDAIKKANTDSENGNLAGIISLIATTEELAEKYGSSSSCDHYKQSIREFLEEISTRPDIVKRYGLEKYVQSQEKQLQVTRKIVQKKEKKRCK